MFKVEDIVCADTKVLDFMVNIMAEDSALQSLSSSEYKCMRRWSTPSVEGAFIHKLYTESDQRKYFHRCQHCGYEQVLDYEKNIELVDPSGIDTLGRVVRPGTYRYVCQKCGKPLDRWYNGHWEITQHGSGRRHGYQISQMNAVWISASALKQEELRAGSKQTFYNYALGQPYQDHSNQFYKEDVLSNLGDFKVQYARGDYSKIAVGIDWGKICSIA